MGRYALEWEHLNATLDKFLIVLNFGQWRLKIFSFFGPLNHKIKFFKDKNFIFIQTQGHRKARPYNIKKKIS